MEVGNGLGGGPHHVIIDPGERRSALARSPHYLPHRLSFNGISLQAAPPFPPTSATNESPHSDSGSTTTGAVARAKKVTSLSPASIVKNLFNDISLQAVPPCSPTSAANESPRGDSGSTTAASARIFVDRSDKDGQTQGTI